MTYVTTRCPSCGKVIRQQTNPVKEIGIPFERCRHCGITYRNSYKEEWITKSPIKRFFFFIQIGVWARAYIVPLLILIIPIAKFDLSREIALIVWPVLSLAWLIAGYFVHKKAERKNIEASLERTKDLEYLNLLQQAGYKIYPIEDTTPKTCDTPQTIPISDESNAKNKEICFCRKCGHKLAHDSLYCNKCGEKVINIID